MVAALKLSIGLLLLALVLWRLDMHAILGAVGSYRPQMLLAAMCIFLVSFLLAVLRWRLFVPQFDYAALLRLSFIGHFYTMVLPGQIAGEAVKAYRIARGQSDKAQLVASVFIDRVVGTLALLCTGAVGLLSSSRDISPALSISFATLIALVCVALVGVRLPGALGASRRVTERFARGDSRWARLMATMARFIDVWHNYAMQPRRLAASFALGLAIQLLGVCLHMILARDLDIDIPLIDWLWITAIVGVAVLLPISIAGIGLREGALVGTLGFLGVPGERAVALSFGVFAIVAFGALIGWLVEIAERPTPGPENRVPRR